MSKPSVAGTVLIYGAAPNPRTGGISSVVHDQVLALTELGYQVLLLFAGPASDSETSIYVCYAAANQPFQWHDVCARGLVFNSFGDLVTQLELAKFRRLRTMVAQVAVVHSHADSIIPREADSGRFNSYKTLLDCVERISGARPKLVRTRHDDLHGGLDRFMRLTGIDFINLSNDRRQSILEGKFDLREAVATRVRSGRDELSSQGISDQYLDDAIHHVWFATAQWQLWRREQRDADAIVSPNHRAVQELRDWMPNGRDNLYCVYNGTSFGNHDQGHVCGLLEKYHCASELRCFRAASADKEPIAFDPADQKILFVGRDDPSKGLVEFVRAISMLYHGGYPNVRAIMAGRFDQYRRTELSEHDPRHAKNYMLFTGRIDEPNELAALLAFGNVTAICSHYDSFNLVASESYRLGTPCVITDETGAAEAYIDHPARLGKKIALPVKKPYSSGINRFYGVDSNSLANQIACLIDDPDLAYTLGQNGRQFVEEHYSYIAMGQRYSSLYQRILAEKSV